MPLTRNEWQNIELNSELDKLYFNGSKNALKEQLKAFRKNGGLKGYRLASHESIDKVMTEISQLNPGQISPSLYESYSENLRKAVDQVFKKDNGNGLSDQLRANVSKFAAYKAYNATIDIQIEMGNDWEDAKMVLHTYNRYQTTEYNTAVSRCRTAKQFEQFNDPDNLRLFPNLRWLPSRSVDPREEHMLFYNRVWPKDDPFWNENTPASLWNCKCDWEETDDPATDGNPSGNKAKTGLKGNPAKSGDVFSGDHPYYGSNIPDNTIRGLLRKDAKQITKAFVGKSVNVTLPAVGDVTILFDGTSKDHFCNDSAEAKDFLIPQITSNLLKYAKVAKCVATAPNMKPDKKKWTVKYYYLECLIGGKKYYLDIEEVNNTAERRHFFRFYSITQDISEYAVMM